MYNTLLGIEQNFITEPRISSIFARTQQRSCLAGCVKLTPMGGQIWYGAGGRGGRIKDWRVWLSKVLEKTAWSTLVYYGQGSAKDLEAKYLSPSDTLLDVKYFF